MDRQKLTLFGLLALVFLIVLALMGAVPPVQPGNTDGMHPYYQNIFYTRLKELTDQRKPIATRLSTDEQITKLMAVVDATSSSKSYVSHANLYSPDDPMGRALMWRLEYAATNKFHVIRLAGEDIDEWVIVGDRAWYGPLWIEDSSETFVHAQEHANVDIVNALRLIVRLAHKENWEILVSDNEKSFRIKGPFAELKGVPEFVSSATEIDFHLGTDSQLSRVDLSLPISNDSVSESASLRFAFGAFGREIPIAIPQPAATRGSDGQLVITSETIQQLPFFDLQQHFPLP